MTQANELHPACKFDIGSYIVQKRLELPVLSLLWGDLRVRSIFKLRFYCFRIRGISIVEGGKGSLVLSCNLRTGW